MDDKDEQSLDETIEETFPASDAPANTVLTGIGGIAPDNRSDETGVTVRGTSREHPRIPPSDG